MVFAVMISLILFPFLIMKRQQIPDRRAKIRNCWVTFGLVFAEREVKETDVTASTKGSRGPIRLQEIFCYWLLSVEIHLKAVHTGRRWPALEVQSTALTVPQHGISRVCQTTKLLTCTAMNNSSARVLTHGKHELFVR